MSYKNNINILCTSVALIAAFLSVGFFSEYLFVLFLFVLFNSLCTHSPRTRERFTEQKILFTGTSALVFFQTSFSALAGYILMNIFHESFNHPIPQKHFIIQSQAYCSAMFFSNKSLLYIDYPTQIITKFCKPITVLLFTLFYSKKYQPRQIYFSIITFSGIALFMYDKFSLLSSSSTNYSNSNFLFGLFLVILSLLCDGVASSEEDIISHDFNVPTFKTMTLSNLYAIPLFSLISIFTGDLAQVFFLATHDPSFLCIILCYIICSVIGQYLIYRLITLANSLLLVAVTNTRKIVTMIISVIVFNHPISTSQIIATCIVFGSLFLDIMTRPSHHSTNISNNKIKQS